MGQRAVACGQSARSLSVGFEDADRGAWGVRVANVGGFDRVTAKWTVRWWARGRRYAALFGNRDAAAAFAASKLSVVLQAVVS